MAAGAMATVSVFGIEYLDLDTIGWYAGGMIATMVFAGAVAFLPAALAVILAEAFGWRSVLYYLLVGGLIGATGGYFTEQAGALDFAERPMVALLAAGFVGGFVYWFIAGRLAGTGYAEPPSGSPSAPA